MTAKNSKKIDHSALAEKIIENLGGVENIHNVSHCATRLRFVMKDRGKTNDEEIRGLSGVLAVVYGSGQYQVILADNLFPVYEHIIKNYDLDTMDVVDEYHSEDLNLQDSDNEPTSKTKKIFYRAIQFMSASMTPFITVLFGAGMLRVVLSLASYFYPEVATSSTYILFNGMSQAPFYFMPILVAYGAARELKSNPVFAITVAGALLYPDFIASVNAGEALTMFGLPVVLVSYANTLLPGIFAAILLAYLERFFYKVVPGVLRSVFAPLLVFVIGFPITILVLGPAGNIFGGWIVSIVVWLQANTGGLAPGIVAAIHPFLVMMGVNMLMVAPMMELFTSVGFDNVFRPGWILHNIAQGGSSLAVMFKTKDKELKATALSASIGAIVSGVSEPALYGINLRLRTPIFGVVAGGFAGGATAGILGAKAFSMGYSSILGIVIFEQTIKAIIIGVIVAFTISFLTTYVLYNDKVLKEIE